MLSVSWRREFPFIYVNFFMLIALRQNPDLAAAQGREGMDTIMNKLDEADAMFDRGFFLFRKNNDLKHSLPLYDSQKHK